MVAEAPVPQNKYPDFQWRPPKTSEDNLHIYGKGIVIKD